MEMGCMWMRRVRTSAIVSFSLLSIHPPTPSSSSSSFLSLNPLPPRSLPLLLPNRHSVSASASASSSPPPPPPPPLVSADDGCPNLGGCEGSGIAARGPKVLLKGMRYAELEKWVQSQGYRPGQALMLWKRMYGNDIWAHSADELHGLNKDFKKMLSERAELRALSLKEIRAAADGTKKILFSLEDGLIIETVIIPCDRGRNTVCVSSQVGCAMNCQFCFTGRMGLTRHLTAAEIVDQAVFAHRLFHDEAGSITNVVFMVRNWIMPINRKYKLSVLLQTLREELHHNNNYKVLFEYVMLAGVNDSFEDAKRLINLVQGIPCKINLISFNPHSGSKFKPTPEEKIIEFRNILAEGGCTVFLRLSRGDDQMAACGQLGKPGAQQAPLLRVPPQFEMALDAAIQFPVHSR
ncbi:hypothetical protein BT93_B2653 [Corymbia citriodora subsp. variegata]|nr:hypothetical protein BT93_B2653 [Corymbia citriodora subsp. variegata]